MDERRPHDSSPSARIGADLLAALQTALAVTDEAERDRLLTQTLSEFAAKNAPQSDSGDTNDQTAALSRKVRSLDEENAVLKDRLAGLQADLDQTNSQLETERERASGSERASKDEAQRVKALQAESGEVAAQLEARNREIHDAQVENDQLLLKVQRAELAQSDTSKLDRAAEGRRELTDEVERLRSELDALRDAKDVQIAQLNKAVADGGSPAADADTVDFHELWLELARAEPPLVIAVDAPTRQTGERAMQLLIELLRFADDVDDLVRPFVGKYTRDHQAIQVPWDVYAKGDGMRGVARMVLHPVDGKSAGVAKVRLRGLYTWLEAALIAADVAIESVASELHAYAMGPGGVADDPTRTIKGFLRDDGHELFQQHMRLLCTRKLAEAFGHSH